MFCCVTLESCWNFEIVEQVRLEGTIGSLWSKAGSKLEMVAPGNIESGVEDIWGWRLHNLSGQPVPVRVWPPSQKGFFVYI